MIYVVLGMHKSGTTLLAQILHHSGISMGEDIDAGVAYDEGNKYERGSCLRLNMEILGAPDYEVLDLSAQRAGPLSAGQRARMQSIITRCSAAHDDWGFKDPRTTLTYQLWAEELPPHRLIAVYRPPAEIWPRFRYTGLRRHYMNPLLAWRFANRWYEHNLRLLDHLAASTQERIVLSYRDLMTTDEEFARLQRFVGRPLVDRRRKDLYRSRRTRDSLLGLALRGCAARYGRSAVQIMQELDGMRRSPAAI
jgi:hypothetical protein